VYQQVFYITLMQTHHDYEEMIYNVNQVFSTVIAIKILILKFSH